jgi:hypothetical protein
VQEFLQSFQRPQCSLFGRFLADPEDCAHLSGAEFLQVAKSKDLALGRGQFGQRAADAIALFLTPGCLAGTCAAIEKAVRQCQDRPFGQVHDGDFAADTAAGGSNVAAILRPQPLAGKLAQPWIEGERLVAQVVVEPPVGLGESLLHHVGGIDSSGEARVEAHCDHPAQPVAVPDQQRPTGGSVPRGRPDEQSFGVGLVHTTLLILTLPALWIRDRSAYSGRPGTSSGAMAVMMHQIKRAKWRSERSGAHQLWTISPGNPEGCQGCQHCHISLLAVLAALAFLAVLRALELSPPRLNYGLASTA